MKDENEVTNGVLEKRIRARVREKRATFDRVLEVVQHLNLEPAAIYAAVRNSQSIEAPALVLSDDGDPLVAICYLRDNYDFPEVLTDALVVALLMTQQIADKNSPEMVEALCEWFSLLEGDFRISDEDKMPKQLLRLCRSQLVLN